MTPPAFRFLGLDAGGRVVLLDHTGRPIWWGPAAGPWPEPDGPLWAAADLSRLTTPGLGHLPWGPAGGGLLLAPGARGWSAYRLARWAWRLHRRGSAPTGTGAALPQDPGCHTCGHLGLIWQAEAGRVRVQAAGPLWAEAGHGLVYALLDETMAWAVALRCARYPITTGLAVRWTALPWGRAQDRPLVVESPLPEGPCRRLMQAQALARWNGGPPLAAGRGRFLLRDRRATLAVDAGFRYGPGTLDPLAPIRHPMTE
ncbi:protein of unknown function [Candidatus Hydrogenisulfobacillus filiaventi]|uniref:Uncharacterized protein n=1 Tax=Candidatus Hydrogenisulfobacillus filiaventi TaxID=2707344 RepID=A0A6F8ZKV2_9FIRM|nr:hypothetical protein [Bacillota bacterium]CAB1130095.1 protein of unknown function [Candidatus Hydrogenisulfobacillus filiaventi]